MAGIKVKITKEEALESIKKLASIVVASTKCKCKNVKNCPDANSVGWCPDNQPLEIK